MIPYAARAVPWSLVLTGYALVAGLMALVWADPGHYWPLQGTAVGVLAGVVAWAMDERSAALVDTLPRGLCWRTAARATVVPPALVTWLTCLLAARGRLPEHVALFVLQGTAAMLLALAVTVSRRATGHAEPGRPFAGAAIPLSAALALARPGERWLPLFPLWPGERWGLSWALWSGVAVAAGILVSRRRWVRRPG